jgi:hypothetical protein
VSMFAASDRCGFLDYFKIPYELADSTGDEGADVHAPGSLRYTTIRSNRGPSLCWPRFSESSLTDKGRGRHRSGLFFFDSLRLYGHIVADSLVTSVLRSLQGHWTAVQAVTDAQGKSIASVWRSDDGSYFFPFDPDEIIHNYWSESYQQLAGSRALGTAKRLARRTYYRVKPALPRSFQIGARRAFSVFQARSSFPRWPIETALHDFYDFLFDALHEIAGGPVPWLHWWPEQYAWAFVLTHDVETSIGYREVQRVASLETAAGMRSSWNFVPARYTVDDTFVAELKKAGFEVGVHGLHHDGRDLASLRILLERLPAIRSYAQRWGAAGFRSPATNRVWEWMPLLGFDYDTSYPDTDPFEPQGGGCCTWLPYFNRDLVELPITLPQDHTLFAILGHDDERAWREKADFLREREGMALVIMHPDYIGDRNLEAYESLLELYAGDETAWKPLPRDVSSWWRRRAASRIRWDNERWTVVGPAAGQATVRLTGSAAHIKTADVAAIKDADAGDD